MVLCSSDLQPKYRHNHNPVSKKRFLIPGWTSFWGNEATFLSTGRWLDSLAPESGVCIPRVVQGTKPLWFRLRKFVILVKNQCGFFSCIKPRPQPFIKWCANVTIKSWYCSASLKTNELSCHWTFSWYVRLARDVNSQQKNAICATLLKVSSFGRIKTWFPRRMVANQTPPPT